MTAPVPPGRARPAFGIVAIAVATILAACGGSIGDAKLRLQAGEALARWADAVAAAGGAAVVPVGDLTRQVGNWEEVVGDNNKRALFAGLVEVAGNIPPGSPGDGEVVWQDGTTSIVPLFSAEQAVLEIRAVASAPCPDCDPLRIVDARLTTGEVETSRGPATAPVWEFTVDGTAVKLTHVAVGNRVVVVPPPWNENDPPVGIWLDLARGAVGSSELTVEFTGSPLPGDQSCGEDYSAQAVESELAVVVIVHRHPALTLGGCTGVGARRTAVAHLAAPLGDRTVLQVYDGTPVRVALSP